MANCDGDCMTDKGYTEAEGVRLNGAVAAAGIRKAAAIANAIDNANQLIKNRKKQRDISDRAMKISEEEHRHMTQVYFPAEEKMIAEYGDNEEPIESLETLTRRYTGRLRVALSTEFDKKIRQARCQVSRYCTSAANKHIQDLLLSKADALAQASVAARQAAFKEIKSREHRNWERKLAVAGIGRGLMGDVKSLLSNASTALDGSGTEYANRVRDALKEAGFNSDNEQTAGQGGFARMPGVSGAQQLYNAFNPQEALQNSDLPGEADFQSAISSGVPVGDQFMAEGDNSWAVPLQENQMNKGRMGNFDLSRSGKMKYEFTDSNGDRGEITVDMADFPLAYTDNKTEGDT